MNYLVNIDIGDGRTDSIRVTPNTNISVLATRFRIKHNLPEEVESTLVEEIQRNCPSSESSPSKIDSIDSSVCMFSTLATTEKTPEKSGIVRRNFPNSGVRIYEQGIRYREIISQKVEKFRKIKEENEGKDLTFAPKINTSACRSSVEKLFKSREKTEER